MIKFKNHWNELLNSFIFLCCTDVFNTTVQCNTAAASKHSFRIHVIKFTFEFFLNKKPEFNYFVFLQRSSPSSFEHFDNRHGEADVSLHDVESLKAKMMCFETRGTLPKLGFVSADKPFLMVSYHVVYNVAKFKKLNTIAEEVI